MEVQEIKNKSSVTNQNEPTQLDMALTMIGFGKFNYILIILSGSILAAWVLETLAIGFVLPVACELNLTITEKGILSGIALVGVITSSLLWGFLADTQGRRKIIMPTLFLSFSCTLLSCLATNYPLLVTLRYFSGFFLSGSSANIYAYLGEFHNFKRSARAIMAASAITGIGVMMSPLLAWLVINQEWSFYIPVIGTLFKPWRLFMLVCGLPSLVCSLVLLKMPESPKFLLSQGNQKDAIEILKTVYSMNTGNDRDSLKIFSINVEVSSQSRETNIFKSIFAQISPMFRKQFLLSTLIACFIQFWINATSQGMYLWFPDIINRVADFTDSNPDQRITVCEIIERKSFLSYNSTDESIELCKGTLDTSTFHISFLLEIFYVIGYIILGSIINRVGKLPILLVTLVFCGTFGIISVFIDIPILGIYFYLILILCGFSSAVVNAATVDLYPTQFRAIAVCMFMMMGLIGSVFGSNFYSTLFENHCNVSFMLSGGSLIACGILGIFIPNIRKSSVEYT